MRSAHCGNAQHPREHHATRDGIDVDVTVCSEANGTCSWSLRTNSPSVVGTNQLGADGDIFRGG